MTFWNSPSKTFYCIYLNSKASPLKMTYYRITDSELVPCGKIEKAPFCCEKAFKSIKKRAVALDLNIINVPFV
jgi:hypothetical protein